MGDELEGSGPSSLIEMEHLLDRAIDGLSRMDSELLVRLACLCREWDTKASRLLVSPAERTRISWKLLLLDRLLRQTRMNLNVLGLKTGQYPSRDSYPNRSGR
jgi:hypothetical protein